MINVLFCLNIKFVDFYIAHAVPLSYLNNIVLIQFLKNIKLEIRKAKKKIAEPKKFIFGETIKKAADLIFFVYSS